jgi:hypothetical protein
VEDLAGGWHGAKEPERPRLGAVGSGYAQLRLRRAGVEW